MHPLIAEILKFCNSLKMKLLEDTGALQNPAGGFFKCSVKVILSVSTYLVCHLLSQSTCITRRFPQTSFLKPIKQIFF